MMASGSAPQMSYNQAAPAQSASNGYYTGPYGMSGQAQGASSALPSAGLAGSGYGAAAAAAPPAYGGYQSPSSYGTPAPYGTPAAQPGGAYRTADQRNASLPAASAAPPTSGYYGGTAATAGANAWNNEQWGRNDTRNGSQPAGYSESVPPRGYEAPAAPSSNPSIPNSSFPATSTSGGGYRPGSTSRSTGALSPSLSAAPTTAPASNVYQAAAGYQAPANPSDVYPAGDAGAARTSSSTGYAGGYSYPTTQMR
jgi:hypothetical protein